MPDFQIRRCLPPERQAYFERFVKEYEHVRQEEGRNSDQAEYYRALPFKDLSGKFSENWKLRARSYVAFIDKVVRPLHQKRSRPLKVIDLGAGNGWLSNRLTLLGHQVSAVDILINPDDGLGACVHYASNFECVQAEFTHLPWPDGYADLAVFNASLHYSENYVATLTEVLRVLNKAGRLVILDSPIYHDKNSGERMVAERESYFQAKFGFKSNSITSQNFLTFAELAELAQKCEIEWQVIKPFYGVKWHLKPLAAKLLGRREPATFAVIVGFKPQ